MIKRIFHFFFPKPKIYLGGIGPDLYARLKEIGQLRQYQSIAGDYCEDIQTLREQNNSMRKTLEFYADEKKWIPHHHALSGMNPEADIDGENGKRARETLAKCCPSVTTEDKK